ncbi:uncharacterized protein LOC129569719 [Sitodiplosis mosellana]|uniref:uncharacterized protein LOC129569719 n=1 Tax=Sitodiplosis mosellana TaxID=263140 RepID=UPI0024441E56|nr:uncharacterized protein LOC129569719 [Sitodiplosis mosellana]
MFLVAMNKTEYEAKMQQLLDDKMTYKCLGRRSPLVRLEKRANEIIETLNECGDIDWKQRARMKKNNTQISRIYAFPKLHKPGHPLRLVNSTTNSPASALSIWLDSFFRNIIHDKYDVKNSQQVKEKLRTITLDENDIIVSLDIVSLFPSIPIRQTIDLIMKKWRKLYRKTAMSKKIFVELLEFVLLEAAVFAYGDMYYQQIDGTEIIDQVLDTLDWTPKMLMKYVDDIFVIIPRNKLDEFVSKLNAVFPQKIVFTVEKETNGTLPYLDLLIQRGDNNDIKVDWYQKPTAANRILNFQSQH